jgi:hypothetical protein
MLQRFPNLDSGQFTTKGYGPSRPIVPNDTEGNRALNRRVEFKVLNVGVLQQEIEKRSKPAGAPSDSTQTPLKTAPPPSPPPGAPADSTRTPLKTAPPPSPPPGAPADSTHTPPPGGGK